MRTIREPHAMQRLAERWRRAGDRVGVVPTMGALHEGHESLLRRARRECDRVVLTIFVNPTQFGPTEDLAQYPRTFGRDKAMAAAQHVDAIFAPSADAMYPPGFCTTVHVDGLTSAWEGAARPTHFDGVTTVVAKLLNITKPHRAYFGQKDAQQAVTVRRMAADLHFDVDVRVCPTVRECDGLALSSRNRYLDRDEREQAICLYDALTAARERVAAGERSAAALKRAMRRILGQHPLARLEYATIVDPQTFEEIRTLNGSALALIAARVGRTRLIDNMPLEAAP